MKWKCVQFAIFHSNFETILDSAVKVDTKLSKFLINDINRNQNLWCCSYLALVAALASEADYVFIPEDPVATDWKDHLCKKLLQVVIKKNFKNSQLMMWQNYFNWSDGTCNCLLLGYRLNLNAKRRRSLESFNLLNLDCKICFVLNALLNWIRYSLIDKQN